MCRDESLHTEHSFPCWKSKQNQVKWTSLQGFHIIIISSFIFNVFIDQSSNSTSVNRGSERSDDSYPSQRIKIQLSGFLFVIQFIVDSVEELSGFFFVIIVCVLDLDLNLRCP